MARQPEAIATEERPDEELPEKAGRVLSVVRNLARELHPKRRHAALGGLDDSLDRDFGLDSLGRAELSLRIERAFRVRLPETLFAAAETPRDFLRAVDRAMAREGAAEHFDETATALPAVPVLDTEPSAALTLTEVLDWHVREHPDRPHILLTGSDGDEVTITYAALAEAAREVAAGLWDAGVLPGDRVAIMLPTSAAFFQAFFGILHAGAVPAPIYPPIRLSLIEDHLRRQAVILSNAGATVLITTEEAVPVAKLVRQHVITLKDVETVDGLRGRGKSAMTADDGAPISAADTALIQYTSGSTGDPKGVVLSHANLLANIRAMGEVMEVTSTDVFVSWLPLYHDMGLIGAWLGSLYFGVPAAIMSPYAFLSRPERWLWAIHRYGGTLSAAPNFAFELCVSRIDDADIEGLDLSSLRMVANGAEAVRPHTVARFTERFAKYGFRPEAMSPMYGLAEDCVGLALPPPGRGAIIDRVNRRDLTVNGVATPSPTEDAEADDRNTAEFVACGHPLPGHEIRLVDETGHEVGERRVGRLQFKGPSATAGYFRNPEKTKALYDGEWLDSGDLAYFAKGELFITGRIKDIVIHAGRNIYPEEVEEAVGDIEGIRKGCVVLFGVEDPVHHTERIVLLAETRAAAEDERAALMRKVQEVATEFLQMPPDEVVLARPRTIPKTSSGKLRRAAWREIYEHGMHAPRRTVRWQILRLALSAVMPQIRRVGRAVGGYAYAVYWRIAYALVGMVTFPLVLLLPKRRWRWAVMHAAARIAFPLMRIPFRITGEASVPAQGVVIAANHSSYLDSLALIAAIPGELIFVAKKELTGGAISGPFLKRLGTVFVERIDPGEAMEGARETLDAAKRGERLAFYPEGTFTRMPGLLDFRMGAFLVAAQSGLPMVPVTIRGTRSILRGDDWFARRGEIEVHVSAPITPDGADFAAAMRLRNAVRAEILRQSGEPDLAHERVEMPGGVQ